MPPKTYNVDSPIKHDGKEYAIGDQIDLDEKEARDLVEAKILSNATSKAESNGQTAPADDAERLAAIVEAIGKLDAGDKSLWTNGGAPKTESIAAITGWPVVAADRNAAWEQINAAK